MSSAADAPSTSVSKAVDDETITEEFVLQVDSPPDLDTVDDLDEMEEVFAYDSKRAYRFERPLEESCPCDVVEGLGCPLLDVSARGGVLVLAFHAPDIETLRDVLNRLKDRWSNVTVDRLIRSTDEGAEDELVFVDRSDLTARQQEVLETAHEMGYFEHPKGANATEVADALDITQATFAEHLAAAQRKLLSSVLEA